MRLTHIKLSGFKSFTDPTTIHVPGQLVAVIGPNGCGKSNVIDAVRWVLGEASAKQLRGESMQDVIFNGAATRRPAPRASVELVFDNSDHCLQGAWGQVCRGEHQAAADAAGRIDLFHQQSDCAPPRHYRFVSGYGRGSARLCCHRAGDDFAHH